MPFGIGVGLEWESKRGDSKRAVLFAKLNPTKTKKSENISVSVIMINIISYSNMRLVKKCLLKRTHEVWSGAWRRRWRAATRRRTSRSSVRRSRSGCAPSRPSSPTPRCATLIGKEDPVTPPNNRTESKLRTGPNKRQALCETTVLQIPQSSHF